MSSKKFSEYMRSEAPFTTISRSVSIPDNSLASRNNFCICFNHVLSKTQKNEAKLTLCID